MDKNSLLYNMLSGSSRRDPVPALISAAASIANPFVNRYMEKMEEETKQVELKKQKIQQEEEDLRRRKQAHEEALIKVQEQYALLERCQQHAKELDDTIKTRQDELSVLVNAQKEELFNIQNIQNTINSILAASGMATGQPAPPKRHMPQYYTEGNSIVYSATGSNDLYQFAIREGGIITFDEISHVGTQSFTCKLSCSFPRRARPLTVSLIMRAGSKQQIKNDASSVIMHHLVKKGWLKDLTICGDIELNPGPAEYEDKLNRKAAYNKQKDDKNKRAFRDYSSQHRRLPVKGKFSGDLSTDMEKFEGYVITQGYASTLARNLPSYMISNAFTRYINTGHLMVVHDDTQNNLVCLHRRILKGATFHTGQLVKASRERALVVRAWRSLGHEELRFARVASGMTCQLPNNVDLTLKDILKHRERIERKKRTKKSRAEYDLTSAKQQMQTRKKFEGFAESDKTYEEFLTKSTEDGFITGTLRKIGSGIARGVKDEVMPILDKVKDTVSNAWSNFPSIKTCATVVLIVIACVLLVIVGVETIMVSRSIIFGIDSICPQEIDMSDTHQQAAFTFAKGVAKSWYDTVSNGVTSFSVAFSDSELVKLTKKLGDFSAALKNISTFIEKMREIVMWVIDKCCSIITGKPFFTSSRNLQKVNALCDVLMTTIATEDLSSMNDAQKSAFAIAYQDLVEMLAYMKGMDKTRASQINVAIQAAKPMYKQCIFYLKTCIDRCAPEWLYLFGLAGMSKTNLAKHLSKQIFDATLIISPEYHKQIWFEGKEPQPFSKTMIYNRAVEQEFWDNYIKQQITFVDDVLQSVAAETRAAEALSLIRMVNSAPYPLHMAAIEEKSTTVFSSKLIVSTTNIGEHKLTDGELQIVEPAAFKRRRSFAVEVTSTEEWVPEGIMSRQFLETITISAHRVHTKTGVLLLPKRYQGYLGISEFAYDVAKDMIAKYETSRDENIMDYTGTMAQIDTIRQHESIQRSQKFNSANKDELDHTIGHLCTKWGLVVDKYTDDYDTTKTEFDDEDDLDAAFRSVEDKFFVRLHLAPLEVSLSTYPDHPRSIEVREREKIREEKDMARVEQQMWLAYKMMIWDQLHPSASHILFKTLGVRLHSISDASEAIDKARSLDSCPEFLKDSGWDYDYLKDGCSHYGTASFANPTNMAREFYYRTGMFQFFLEKETNHPAVIELCRFHDIKQKSIRRYIGLSNEIYYHRQRDRIVESIEQLTFTKCYIFDDLVKLTAYKSSLPEAIALEYEWDIANETILKGQKGRSSILNYLELVSVVITAFTVIAAIITGAVYLYTAIAPGSKVNMAFLEQQSGSPHLKNQQKELARARKRPIQKMAHHAKQQGSVLSKPVRELDSKEAEAARLQATDQNASDLIRLLNRNMYLVELSPGQEHCYCLGIEGNLFVFPSHLFAIPGAKDIILTHIEDTTRYSFSIDSLELFYVKQKGSASMVDLVLIRLPGFHNVHSITHLLQTEDEDVNGAEGFCRYDRFIREENGKEIFCESITPALEDVKIVNGNNVAGLGIRLEGVTWVKMYELSEYGMCGRPYIFFNTKIRHKLGWLHVAGVDTVAIAARITQEDIQAFKKKDEVDMTKAQRQVKELTYSFEPHILPEHNSLKVVETEGRKHSLYKIGNSSHRFSYPTKTQLLPTPFAKTFTYVQDAMLVAKEPFIPLETLPAPLRGDGDTEPIVVALKSMQDKIVKYGKTLKVQDFSGIFNDALKDCDPSILPIWEAIIGMSKCPKSHSIKRSTSTAFYLQKFGKLKREYVCFNDKELNERKDKNDFVNMTHGVYLHRFIIKLIMAWFACAEKGKIPLNWVLACLKDEPLSLDKVAEFKTRVFFMGNFALMIISKMIFGSFTVHLEKNWHKTDTALGCNPYSAHWRIIYDKIRSISSEVMDDDTKKWDQNFPVTEFVPTFTEAYCTYFNITHKEITIEILGHTYTFMHFTLIYIMCMSNFSCAIVLWTEVYFCMFMPSGVDVTCLFNSICNSAINRAIVRILLGVPFEEVAAQWTYGDDLLLAIIGLTRQQVWDAAKFYFNHTRTMPDKSPICKNSSLDDCFFLQRQFKFDGVMMSPLNIKSINTMLQWIMKPKDKTLQAQFVINCKVALSELSRHSEKMFNLYYNEINFYLAQYGSSWVIHTTFLELRKDTIFRAIYDY